MKEKELGLKFWAAVAVSAIGMGVVIAFVAGFFLGHFTGHHSTTTVAASGQTVEESTSSESSEEGEKVTASNGIVLAPEFTSDELYEHAGDNWITNGGSTTNDRFSTLDEINTENVSELKGDCVTKIGKEATAAKFSAEGQALEYEGTIYIPDGADNVYAIDASSGEILWTYEPHLPPDPLGEVVCCGWDNRGVAIGDGMVFVSQLNGDQVALDQETGKVAWQTNIENFNKGFSITSAPLYYNGKVYVGGSGGEYGIRGRLTALDAKTGKMDWRFWTTPEPERNRRRHLARQRDAYKEGGASLWNTPTVDPKNEMIYFSTSNASPWLGGNREGENLFTASIVALDAETGKYKWHYQQVHHDLWDFDSPSPTVLFDGEMNGEMREGVGEPSKTGWVYLLDRKTGKPIYPIPEVKVPQDPSQKTWPTQPEPTMAPFSPIETTPEAVENGRRSGVRRHAETENRRHENLHPDELRPELDQPDRRTRRSAATTGRRPPSTRKRTCTSSARRPARWGWSCRRRNRNSSRARTRSDPKRWSRPASTSEGFLTAYDMSHRRKSNGRTNSRGIVLLGRRDHRRRPRVRRPQQR